MQGYNFWPNRKVLAQHKKKRSLFQLLVQYYYFINEYVYLNF